MMLKYEYKNATVYITKPTEAHMRNIRAATEVFLKRLLKEEIQNEQRRNNHGARGIDINTRQRD